jgi:hypothetical protein
MDGGLVVGAVLLSADGASWPVYDAAGGFSARRSGSLGLSDWARCALTTAANAKQIEKIAARLADFMLRPVSGALSMPTTMVPPSGAPAGPHKRPDGENIKNRPDPRAASHS